MTGAILEDQFIPALAGVSESRLKSLVDTILDTMVDGVITLNEDCEIQSYNKACVDIFGYGPTEVLGKNIYMLIDTPCGQDDHACLEEYREKNGRTKIIGTSEVVGRHKNGAVFPMELTVGETSQGGQHCLVGIVRDITQRKVALEAKKLLASIVESSTDAVIGVSAQSTIISWNAAAEQLFGHSAIEAIGQPISLIIPPDRLEEEQRILTQLQSGKKVKHFDTQRMMKSGRTLDVSLTVSPIRNADGEITGSSKIVRDISERHEGEKARDQLRQSQKMEALGQLTGGLAHDFNNLLAVILGNLDFMIERTKEDDPLRTFLKPSIEAAEHGAELTRQLLAFSRQQALQPKIISMNELLPNFITMVKHTLGERIKLALTLASDLWNVSVDPSQLQNALLNLAVNARDAMPGGGRLIFKTENIVIDETYTQAMAFEVIPGEYILLTISDTGEGMTQEVAEKAFDPFFTTKDAGKGSGLGLSMVYGFVKQSKGHIRIDSEMGHGTAIRIYLPRANGAVIHLEQAAEEKPVRMEKKHKRVLVVEDNKDVLTLTSAMVESLGYSVSIAESGDAAKEILETCSDIELLLTDVMLPGALDGPALASWATTRHPGLKVLFNSGYAEDAILQSGLLEAGVNLIAKPFRKQQLANKIEEVLNQA